MCIVLDFPMNLLVSRCALRSFSLRKTFFACSNFSSLSNSWKSFDSSSKKKQTKQTFEEFEKEQKNRRVNIALYMGSVAILMAGLTYASVPLYKMFCEATGFDGIVRNDDDEERVSANIRKLADRKSKEHPMIRVHFSSTPSSLLPWTFEPEQSEISIQPGETALAFYRAKNESNRPIIGIATYNVQPSQAAFYFNKIQCFCFEEQRLEPDEEIDMPVFFYIDPDFLRDPSLQGVKDISLSYTFFESKGTEYLAMMGTDPAMANKHLKPSEALPYAHKHSGQFTKTPA